MAVLEKVKKALIRHSMFSPGDTALVAVSGGADSVFLLYALLDVCHELGIRLEIAHLNHGLRKGAKKDQRFVEALSQKLNLPLTVGVLKKRVSKKGQSIEDFAREERFKFLSKTAKKRKARIVALGHTQNDLAETVLMRILRGTGLYGLRGILPVREINGQTYVRPLLDINRKEIEQFLRKRKINFCSDETNASTAFLRNKIRLQLLPALRKNYNEDIDGILANLARSVSADYDYLFGQIAPELKKHSQNGTVRLPVSRIKRLHPALQRLLIRLSIEHLQGDTRRLNFDHIEEIRCVSRGRKNRIFLLPKGLRVECQDGHIILGPKKHLIKLSDTL